MLVVLGLFSWASQIVFVPISSMAKCRPSSQYSGCQSEGKEVRAVLIQHCQCLLTPCFQYGAAASVQRASVSYALENKSLVAYQRGHGDLRLCLYLYFLLILLWWSIYQLMTDLFLPSSTVPSLADFEASLRYQIKIQPQYCYYI